ncbi:MAG TPA: hotdog domain-containing protein [Planctomycetia bacterium]|nr:hotdog domain-containing protein [Planctomycetia bacterium]
MPIICSHRLILPADANHYGTLYAGSLLRLALEAGYATAYRHVGPDANLVLRRVLNLECLRPVPVGTVVEIQGLVLHAGPAYLVTGLVGAPLSPDAGPWLESLMGFAQVNEAGAATGFPQQLELDALPDVAPWPRLFDKLQKLVAIR